MSHLALSIFFLLIVFSISFKPLSVEEEANRLATAVNENMDEAFTKQGLNKQKRSESSNQRRQL